MLHKSVFWSNSKSSSVFSKISGGKYLHISFSFFFLVNLINFGIISNPVNLNMNLLLFFTSIFDNLIFPLTIFFSDINLKMLFN